MLWKIEFYNKTVEANIKKWPDSIMPKFLWQLNFIEKMGPNKIGMPYIKSLGQGLFKISVKSDEATGCALFCISTQDKTVIILDGFIEKTQKIMPDEIIVARSRMNDIKATQL